ncbi:MAG: hypothetical protein ABI583_07805 [Betaproteobacteria bacterium]
MKFVGKQSLLAAKSLPLRKKLITILFDSLDAYAWGGEGIVIDCETVVAS